MIVTHSRKWPRGIEVSRNLRYTEDPIDTTVVRPNVPGCDHVDWSALVVRTHRQKVNLFLNQRPVFGVGGSPSTFRFTSSFRDIEEMAKLPLSFGSSLPVEKLAREIFAVVKAGVS